MSLCDLYIFFYAFFAILENFMEFFSTSYIFLKFVLTYCCFF